MKKEEKQLLLQDLCARLPYGVKANSRDGKKTITITPIGIANFMSGAIDIIKPYLRPMSSMTEEEKKELVNHVLGGKGAEFFHVTEDGSIDGNQKAEQELYNLNLYWLSFDPLTTSSYLDWLNKKMFDYRGLIPKGLANSTEEFNPYKD